MDEMNEKKDDVIDISKFYSRGNEENGKWYEPRVRGVKVGFEIKIYGPNSTTASVAHENYKKAKAEIEKITDIKEKAAFADKALTEYAATLCCDIRPVGNNKLVKNDGVTPVTKDDIREILYQAPIIAEDIALFQNNQNNFLSN